MEVPGNTFNWFHSILLAQNWGIHLPFSFMKLELKHMDSRSGWLWISSTLYWIWSELLLIVRLKKYFSLRISGAVNLLVSVCWVHVQNKKGKYTFFVSNGQIYSQLLHFSSVRIIHFSFFCECTSPAKG